MDDDNGNLSGSDDEAGRDPDGSGRLAGTDALPELPAPSPGGGGDEPARAPIRLSDLRVPAAKLVLERPLALGASMLEGVEAGEMRKLVATTIDRVVARARGGQEEGISIAELAERAQIGRGRMGERFDRQLPLLADIVVRAVQAQAGNHVFYEEIASHRAKAGRRHNGVGTDRAPRGRNGLHVLDYSFGCSDRHCAGICEPLLTGTRWDPADPRFGEGLPRWAVEAEASLPSSLADHLARVLAVDDRARSEVGRAMREGRGAFSGRLTARRMAAAFSPFLVVPPILYGRPAAPHRGHRDVLRPGRDEQTIDWARGSGRHVVLACGEPTIGERLEFEDGSQALEVGELPSMYALDLQKKYSVEYRWSPQRHELGRYEAGRGAGLEIWRFVGYDGEQPEVFWQMLAVVERQVQVTWTEDCLRRWEADCRPGLQKAHTPQSCAGVRALLMMANAGVVDALRRQARGSEFSR